MTFINTIDPEDAPEEVRVMYRQLQGRLDYLPNYARVFSHRPGVMSAWAALQEAIRLEIDARDYSLITLAAARAMGSSYCALAHARKLCRHYFSETELIAILRNPAVSSLTAVEQAMMALVEKVVRCPSAITQGDVDALREQGLDDTRIFDIVTAAAARCFFARVPDALGAKADRALGEMDPALRTLLVVGRPLEDGE